MTQDIEKTNATPLSTQTGSAMSFIEVGAVAAITPVGSGSSPVLSVVGVAASAS
jgi:hypothetical protein